MNRALPRTLGVAILAISLFFVGFSIGRQEPAGAQPEPSVRPSVTPTPNESVPTGFFISGHQNFAELRALGSHEVSGVCAKCAFEIHISTGDPSTNPPNVACPSGTVCQTFIDPSAMVGASDTSTSVEPTIARAVNVIIWPVPAGMSNASPPPN